MFVAMHGNRLNATVSLRRPSRARIFDPAGQVNVDVNGATAADMLWETGSFQAVISKDRDRPVVGLICSAAQQTGVFAKEFSARMFERGFESPIYLGESIVFREVRLADGSRRVLFPELNALSELFTATGTQSVFAGFKQAVPGQNPIAVFQPPSK